MIPVTLQPEPPEFDQLVRRPGLLAVAAGTDPLPNHWTKCLDDLYDAYGGVCAYASFWIPQVSGGRSVEHFAPKSRHRSDAYEWSNYRLVCSLMNARKREFEDVVDPFAVGSDWFVLVLLSLEVRPGEGLGTVVEQQVLETIKRLQLNDSRCIAQRKEHLDWYLKGAATFEYLRRVSPFLAEEVARQGWTRS